LLKQSMRLGFFSLLFCFCLVLPVQAGRFSLLHTAGVKGLASNYHYQIQQPYQLIHEYARQNPDAIRSLRTQGASIYFYHQGHYVWGPGLGIERFQQFLSQLSSQKPTDQRALTLLDTSDSIVLEPNSAHDLLSKLRPLIKQNPGSELTGAQLDIYPGPIYVLHLDSAEEAPNPDPHVWEMLLGLQLNILENTTPTEWVLIGKPSGDGPRRLNLLSGLKDPQTLLVDSGNLLEGLSSVNTASLSLQRENSLKALQNLGYFALNIGAEELRGGLDNLLREQEQYNLPWISASLRQNGQYLFAPYKLAQTEDGKILALIGIGNHNELEQLQERGLLGAGTEILSPATAIKWALKSLEEELKQPADLIAILTNAEGPELENLAQTSAGVDLILGETLAPLRPSKLQLERVKDPHQTPFVVANNPQALGLLQVQLEAEQMQIQNEILPVSFDLKPDPVFLNSTMHIRQEAYRDALDELLPDLSSEILANPVLLQQFLNSEKTRQARQRLEGRHSLTDSELLRLYPPRLSSEMWGVLLSNLLLKAFDCEVVLVEKLPDGIYVPGAWPRLLVYEMLKDDATLEGYLLSGADLDRLLKLPLNHAIQGGTSADKSKVWNRPRQKNAYYRTLISSSLAQSAELAPLLKGVRKHEELRNPFAPHNPPERLYLRNILLSFLEQTKASGKLKETLLSYLEPQWHQKQPLWSLQVSDLQLNLSGYNAMNNQSYSAVRETRVTSPNSFTYGGRSKISLIFDNANVSWIQSLQAKYEGLSLLDESSKQNKFTENQDDLLFSSELQLQLFEFPFGDKELQLIPYLEGTYDTEFSPTLQPNTGQMNPLQAELSGIVGLTIPPGPMLKAFKTGLALRRDFNVPNNLELGLQFKLDHELPLTAELKWTNSLDLKYYLPSVNDNASSLGLISQWVSALKVSLTDNLSLRFFADAYLFQGKLPSTSELGSSIILGVGLAYDRLWKPFYEPI
jgi:hypothetical protein